MVSALPERLAKASAARREIAALEDVERAAIQSENGRARAPAFEFYTIGDPPLVPKPRNYLVPGLNIAPGLPNGFVAYAWSGKSIIIQDMVLSILTGTPVWGHFECRKGGGVHFDYDQGRAETEDRYHRLMRARELDGSVMKDLLVTSFPRMRLTDSGALKAYVEAVKGRSFFYIDTYLASLAANVDENAASIAQYLYILGEVSEATGATGIVTLHTGHGDVNGGAAQKRDRRSLTRGHSSLIGAMSTAFHVAGAPSEPKRVSMMKGRSLGGVQTEDFEISLETVRIPHYLNPENHGDPGGFRVTYTRPAPPSERASEPRARGSADEHRKSDEQLEQRIVRAVLENPGQITSRDQLRAIVGAGSNPFDRVATRMLTAARLVKPGKYFEIATGTTTTRVALSATRVPVARTTGTGTTATLPFRGGGSASGGPGEEAGGGA